MKKIIAIVGPTGVGKTKLSIELAKKYDGEVINFDSMQVYKGLDIGTAKVKEEEKEGIKHHLIDIVDVNQDYTIYHYQSDAREKIREIQNRGKTVIMVGGTGLYLKAALYDYHLEKEVNNSQYDDKTVEQLYQELIELDSEVVIDKHNKRRVIRALNYIKANNKSINANKTDKLLYDTIFIGLTTDREILYNRINERVEKMINEGLIQEVRKFYDDSIYDKPLINGIGYKELYQYFNNEISLEEAIDKIKKNSRHYAKRQYTFFNNQIPVVWFNVSFNDFNKTIEKVSNYIDNN